jgi:hypothetical protein
MRYVTCNERSVIRSLVCGYDHQELRVAVGLDDHDPRPLLVPSLDH